MDHEGVGLAVRRVPGQGAVRLAVRLFCCSGQLEGVRRQKQDAGGMDGAIRMCYTQTVNRAQVNGIEEANTLGNADSTSRTNLFKIMLISL